MKRFMQVIFLASTLVVLPAFGMSRFSSFSKRLGSFAASKFGAFRNSFARSIPKMRNFSNTAFRSPKSRFFKGIVGAGFATACAGVQKATKQESATQVKEYANVDDLIDWKGGIYELDVAWWNLITNGGLKATKNINRLYQSIQKEAALIEEMNHKIATFNKKAPKPFSLSSIAKSFCSESPYFSYCYTNTIYKNKLKEYEREQQEKEKLRCTYQAKINNEKEYQHILRTSLYRENQFSAASYPLSYFTKDLDKILHYLSLFDRLRS